MNYESLCSTEDCRLLYLDPNPHKLAFQTNISGCQRDSKSRTRCRSANRSSRRSRDVDERDGIESSTDFTREGILIQGREVDNSLDIVTTCNHRI